MPGIIGRWRGALGEPPSPPPKSKNILNLMGFTESLTNIVGWWTLKGYGSYTLLGTGAGTGTGTGMGTIDNNGFLSLSLCSVYST